MNLRARSFRRRVTAATAIALLPLFFSSGCGSGSSTSAPPAGELAVEASPSAQAFSGPSVQVTLTAVNKTDPNPVIHYTLNLSEPTAVSPVYNGPFALTETTVVKAIAINPDGSESGVLVKGYVLADSSYYQQWSASGHGDIAGEPFRHWDEDGSVSTSCARCHGGGGLKDWAADGVVDSAGTLALGHDCNTCHAPVPLTIYDAPLNYPALVDVEFPSSATASLHDSSNLCLACHQGRESGLSVDEDIDDNPDGPFRFVNIHYYAAGATFFGAETNGGYQYAGKEYVGRNTFPSHELEQQSCVGCHMRGNLKDHTLVPEVADCTSCHTGSSFETLSGSPSSNYDAIQATHPQLLAAMQAYAKDTLGFPIAYAPYDYPYFVNDLNDNGVADEDEIGSSNRYEEFDQKLLKAAYNYQVVAKDPAGYIHNGVYLRQLLHDSLADLGVQPAVAAPGRSGFILASATKSEQWHVSGHSDSTAEAFRHWDGDGEVSASCARCHTSSGFIDYIADGSTDAPGPLGETVSCMACHNDTNLFADPSTRYADLVNNPELLAVNFPSGATGDLGDASNLCMTCHQGRESGVSVDTNSPNSVVQSPVDYDSFNFINRHYYAAAAIMFGSDVTASYEYAGQTYAGVNTFAGHGGEKDTCLDCHMRGAEDHSFRPQLVDCNQCHLGITEFEGLGLPDGTPNVDYDGNGLGESFDAEIKGMAEILYAQIQAYSDTGLPQPSLIVYGPGSYPYWFKDTNGDGLLSPGEDSYANGYKDFDRELLRAAYNYHSAQDPCGDIHNYKYVLQSLYDSADMLDGGGLDDSIGVSSGAQRP
jgi:hypothetical protein